MPIETFNQIADKILALEDNPRPSGCKKMRGLELYRIRVGEYRILYFIDDKESLIEIQSVGHRKDIYR